MTTRSPFDKNPWEIHMDDADEDAQMRAIIDLTSRKDLSEQDQRAIFEKMDPDRRLTNKAIDQIETQMRAMNADRAKTELLVATWNKYRDWENTDVRYVLQPNDCSRLHKMREAVDAGLFYDGDETRFVPPNEVVGLDKYHVFVVRHDWAAAFGDSMSMDDPFKLPAELCAFEFRVSGRTAVMLARAGTDFFGVDMTVLLEGEGGIWFTMPTEVVKTLGEFLTRQVRAISVALEAQVATHSLTRAPSKLNAKREKAGKPPLLDFHIIDLSRRARADRRPDETHTGRRVRLHFRRGHWRHFESHKTWIEWMLVGDPDLGFIDKHYRI